MKLSQIIQHDTNCRHCGAEIPKGAVAIIDVDEVTKIFCDEDCWAINFANESADQAREDAIDGQY